MTSHRSAVGALALALTTALALTACSSSSKALDPSSSTTSTSAAATSSVPSTPTTAKTSATVAVPTNGCLLTDAQASQLVGAPLKGTSTKIEDGTFCTYTEASGAAGVSVSVKPYANPADGKKIVDGLLSNEAKIYVDGKAIDVDDGGAVASAGPLAYARFMDGNIFVEVTVRPGDAAKAEQAAKEAAAKL